MFCPNADFEKLLAKRGILLGCMAYNYAGYINTHIKKLYSDWIDGNLSITDIDQFILDCNT